MKMISYKTQLLQRPDTVFTLWTLYSLINPPRWLRNAAMRQLAAWANYLHGDTLKTLNMPPIKAKDVAVQIDAFEQTINYPCMLRLMRLLAVVSSSTFLTGLKTHHGRILVSGVVSKEDTDMTLLAAVGQMLRCSPLNRSRVYPPIVNSLQQREVRDLLTDATQTMLGLVRGWSKSIGIPRWYNGQATGQCPMDPCAIFDPYEIPDDQRKQWEPLLSAEKRPLRFFRYVIDNNQLTVLTDYLGQCEQEGFPGQNPSETTDARRYRARRRLEILLAYADFMNRSIDWFMESNPVAGGGYAPIRPWDYVEMMNFR